MKFLKHWVNTVGINTPTDKDKIYPFIPAFFAEGDKPSLRATYMISKVGLSKDQIRYIQKTKVIYLIHDPASQVTMPSVVNPFQTKYEGNREMKNLLEFYSHHIIHYKGIEFKIILARNEKGYKIPYFDFQITMMNQFVQTGSIPTEIRAKSGWLKPILMKMIKEVFTIPSSSDNP